MMNNLEGKPKTFINGELWAMNTPINVYSAADESKYVYSIPKNQYVGKIYSYLERDGKIWWQLDSNNPRFVKHETGKFNEAKLLESLIKWQEQRDKEIEEAVQKRKDAGGFQFSNLFENWGDLIKDAIPVLVIILIILIVISRK